MTWLIFLCVAAGFAGGHWLLPDTAVGSLNMIVNYSLALILFMIGVDLGKNKHVLPQLRRLGWRVLYLPGAIALGSIGGALAAGMLMGLPANAAGAAGAGFGWYSLSGPLVTSISGPALGSLAFLTNLFRELLAVAATPWLAKRCGSIFAAAPGGATAMDTTLPIIAAATDPGTTLMAFTSGAVLSALVPLLLPLLLHYL